MKTEIQNIREYNVEFITEDWTEKKRVDNLSGERKILDNVLDNVTEVDVFYDIGANIGIYTMFVAAKIGGANVVAVEPHPTNINRLHSNAELNSFNNITILDYAFFDTDKVSSIRQTNTDAGEGKHHIHTGTGTIDVNVDRGDTVIRKFNIASPNVIKIDVEGTEYHVLEGMKESIEDSECRLIYIELHPNKMIKYGNSSDDVINFLDELGYHISNIGERGGEKFIKAQRK